MMLSLESLAYKADDAGGEFNAAQREVGCQHVNQGPFRKAKQFFLNFFLHRFSEEWSR